MAWSAVQAKLDDARFSAIFSNPAFALDPTDPRYSQSAGAQELAATIAKRKKKQQSASQAGGAATRRKEISSVPPHGKAEKLPGADFMRAHACMLCGTMVCVSACHCGTGVTDCAVAGVRKSGLQRQRHTCDAQCAPCTFSKEHERSRSERAIGMSVASAAG